jgi:hypothetical protein
MEKLTIQMWTLRINPQSLLKFRHGKPDSTRDIKTFPEIDKAKVVFFC